MDLAESVNGGKSTRPGNFDAQFVDSEYLINEGAKSRLRGYLRTFGYMVFCGLLLLIGGGAFFIYESMVIKRLPERKESQQIPTGRLAAPIQDEYLMQDKAQYSKDFQIVAFVFIGVGVILLMVGIPFVSQVYRRYRRAKEVERSPILDPLNTEKKGKIYNKNPQINKKTKSKKKDAAMTSTEDANSSLTTTSDKLSFMSKRSKRRKSKTGWMYRSPQRISNESFRFAAHRHPSMNHIQIDGSHFFEKHTSRPGSDEDLEESKIKEGAGSLRRGLRGFVNKIFRRSDDQTENLVSGDATYETTKRESTSTSNDERRDYPPSLRIGGYIEMESDEEHDISVSQDGLYNLGQ